MNIFHKLFALTSRREKIQLTIFIIILLTFVIVEAASIALLVPLIDSLGAVNEEIPNKFLFSILSFFSLPVKGIELVYTLVVIYFIMAFSKSLLHILVLKLTAKIPYDIFYNKSNQLIDKYYKMPWSKFSTVSSNEVIKKVTKSNEMAAYAYVIALQFITAIFIVVFLSSMLFVYNFLITLALVSILGFAVFIIFTLMKSIQKKAGIEREFRLSGVFKTASEAILSMKDQKVFKVENHFFTNFLKESKGLSKALKDVTFYPPTQLIFVEFFAIICLLTVIIYIISNNMNIAAIVPSLAFYAFAFRRIVPSMGLISSLSMTLKNLEASVDIIYEEIILQNDNSFKESYKKNTKEFNQDWNLISFENIEFSYDKKSKVLSNINIEFKKNSRVGIVGESGSGKSTLIDIFCGLNNPSSGNLKIDNVPYDNLSILRGNIGYVPQMLNILDSSILENVLFGRAYDEEKLNASLKKSFLDDFVNTLPEGINTMLGERGVKLSGGQRQRIAIARALYDNPDIIVFDEATSSLDNISEKYISDMIWDLSKSKTIIAVAHRLTTVKDFDILYVLEEGKIVAKGKHHELLKSNETYAKMNEESNKNN